MSSDIELGLATISRNIPGWASHGTFAVPFNNYGQNGSNDSRIEPWLGSYLKARFTAVFVQRDDAFTRPRGGFENRIHVPGSGPPTRWKRASTTAASSWRACATAMWSGYADTPVN